MSDSILFHNRNTDPSDSPLRTAFRNQQTQLCIPPSVMQPTKQGFGSVTAATKATAQPFKSDLLKIITKPPPQKLKRPNHYEIKTTVQNVIDKFEDENVDDAIHLSEHLLMSAPEETVHNYFKQVVEDNAVTWDRMSQIYNDLADLMENKQDKRSGMRSVKILQDWVLPYLLTPVKGTGCIKSLPSQVFHAGNVNIIEMLNKEGVNVINLDNHFLADKKRAMRWIDLLEKEGFLVTNVTGWGDDRGVLTEVGYGLNLHNTIDSNRNDPDLVKTCADEAREFVLKEVEFNEVQYISIQTNENMETGLKN